MLLSYEEKGKCSVVRQGAEFPSIGDQPEAKANQWWPCQPATLRLDVEARVDKTGGVFMVGMVARALLCDRGRPRTVLRPEILKRPEAGIPSEGSRGITERESQSKAVRGVGWTHSSDEERADDTQNPSPPKMCKTGGTTGGDCTRRKPGPAKGSWSGMVEAEGRNNACQRRKPESSCAEGKHADWTDGMADAEYVSEAYTGKTW